MIKRVDLVNQLCKKLKVRRKSLDRNHLTKPELLLLNSAADLLLHANEAVKDLGKTSESEE